MGGGKSSILKELSTINHPAIGVPPFMEAPVQYMDHTPFTKWDAHPGTLW